MIPRRAGTATNAKNGSPSLLESLKGGSSPRTGGGAWPAAKKSPRWQRVRRNFRPKWHRYTTLADTRSETSESRRNFRPKWHRYTTLADTRSETSDPLVNERPVVADSTQTSERIQSYNHSPEETSGRSGTDTDLTENTELSTAKSSPWTFMIVAGCQYLTSLGLFVRHQN